MSHVDFSYISPSTNIETKIFGRQEMMKSNFGGYLIESGGRKNNAKTRGDHLQSFKCPNCPSCFSQNRNLTRHLKYECQQPPRFQCPYCNFRSKQTSNVLAHVRSQHAGQKTYCLHLKRES